MTQSTTSTMKTRPFQLPANKPHDQDLFEVQSSTTIPGRAQMPATGVVTAREPEEEARS